MIIDDDSFFLNETKMFLNYNGKGKKTQKNLPEL